MSAPAFRLGIVLVLALAGRAEAQLQPRPTYQPFGLPGTFEGPEKELLFQGVYAGGYVIDPAGTLLGSFDFGGNVGNVAGGEGGSTLFIAPNAAVYRVRVSTSGAGFQRHQLR